jgi:hypothetical protein
VVVSLHTQAVVPVHEEQVIASLHTSVMVQTQSPLGPTSQIVSVIVQDICTVIQLFCALQLFCVLVQLFCALVQLLESRTLRIGEAGVPLGSRIATARVVMRKSGKRRRVQEDWRRMALVVSTLIYDRGVDVSDDYSR